MEKLDAAFQTGNFNNVVDLISTNPDNDDYLIWSIINGYYGLVKLCLDKGNFSSIDKNYALILAADVGDTNIIQLLLNNGANPLANNNATLYIAINKNHYRAVELLINQFTFSDAVMATALQSAIINGNTEITKLLVDNGAPVTESSKLHAINNYKIETLNFLLTISTPNENNLLNALKTENLNIVQTVLNHNPIIQSQNDVLQFAVNTQNIRIVKLIFNYLSKLKIHINRYILISQILSAKDPEVIEFLLNQVSNIHKNNDDLLYQAIFRGNISLVKELLKRGADIYIPSVNIWYDRDYDGHPFPVYEHGDNKALIEAIRGNQLQMIDFLLSIGLPIGNDHLKKAINDRNSRILKILLDHHKNIDQEILIEAIKTGNLNIIKTLLNNANRQSILFNIRSALREAHDNRLTEIYQLLLSYST